MTDLLHVLPDFHTSRYTHLIPSLERNSVSISDLLTLDTLEVAKKTQLPLLDLRRFIGDVNDALQQDLQGNWSETAPADRDPSPDGNAPSKHGLVAPKHLTPRSHVSLLDPSLDVALDGGIATGYVTEITGESGVGKTQFLLTLLLAAQLSPVHGGLGRSSIYISTEAPLSTKRLAQILEHHPRLSALPANERPSLTKVRAIPVGDLEAQDHILEYQLPAAIKKFDVGLIVLDSVAANYRAEHGSAGPKDLADRATRLAKLGHLLRRMAVREDVAIVIANQVSDRLEKMPPPSSLLPPSSFHHHHYSSSPILPSSSSPIPSSQPPLPPFLDDHNNPTMTLDYQQRFFTGWGDEPSSSSSSPMKTPALGLAWTNQISCRIALKFCAPDHSVFVKDGNHDFEQKLRFMKIVFCPWAKGHDGTLGAGFEIVGGGVRGVDVDR